LLGSNPNEPGVRLEPAKNQFGNKYPLSPVY
jgi:hypothetical protein